MKKILILLTLAVLPVTMACSRLAEPESSGEMTLRASFAESGGTRTQIGATMLGRWDWQITYDTIFWNRTDELNVFSGSGAAGKFAWSGSYGSYGVGALFTGVLDGPVSETDSPRFWAFYPYNPDNTFDGNSITFSLPSKQRAYQGSFAPGTLPHLATSESLDEMPFYNVCGGACFSVTRTAVQSVVFRSNGGEPLSGKVRVGIDDDGHPVIKEVIEGVDSVVVTASPNVLIPNNRFNYYFAVMLPQTLSGGMTITLRLTDGKALYIPIRKPVEIRRNVFGYMQDMDQYAQDEIPSVPIKDIHIREAFINAFDTDKDGVLSVSEAAAVSSDRFFSVLNGIYVDGLGNIGSVCTSFEEFRYFTGVTSIPVMGFQYWSKATQITLPESLLTIGTAAFSYCGSLKNLTIPEKVRKIDNFAFAGCNPGWVVVKPVTPPSAGTDIFEKTYSFPIYVPDAAVDTYKNTEGWSTYTDRIRPMSEFKE